MAPQRRISTAATPERSTPEALQISADFFWGPCPQPPSSDLKVHVQRAGRARHLSHLFRGVRGIELRQGLAQVLFVRRLGH